MRGRARFPSRFSFSPTARPRPTVRSKFWCIELALAVAATPAAAQHEGHMGGAVYPPFGSGTSWLPAVAPMRGFHFQASDWSVMVHGSVFGQFIQEFGPRGNYQLGSINMVTRPEFLDRSEEHTSELQSPFLIS